MFVLSDSFPTVISPFTKLNHSVGRPYSNLQILSSLPRRVLIEWENYLVRHTNPERNPAQLRGGCCNSLLIFIRYRNQIATDISAIRLGALIRSAGLIQFVTFVVCRHPSVFLVALLYDIWWGKFHEARGLCLHRSSLGGDWQRGKLCSMACHSDNPAAIKPLADNSICFQMM